MLPAAEKTDNTDTRIPEIRYGPNVIGLVVDEDDFPDTTGQQAEYARRFVWRRQQLDLRRRQS